MTKKNLHILDRFPEKSHLLTYHMAMDPDFYDLCQDYEVCVNALKYWTASKDPNAGVRLNEYYMLVTELEQDIINELEAFSHEQ